MLSSLTKLRSTYILNTCSNLVHLDTIYIRFVGKYQSARSQWKHVPFLATDTHYEVMYTLWGMMEVVLVSPDGVAPSQMVCVSASVNLPLHHKVQKFSSGTGSPGWSRKKGRKTVVVVVYIMNRQMAATNTHNYYYYYTTSV